MYKNTDKRGKSSASSTPKLSYKEDLREDTSDVSDEEDNDHSIPPSSKFYNENTLKCLLSKNNFLVSITLVSIYLNVSCWLETKIHYL